MIRPFRILALTLPLCIPAGLIANATSKVHVVALGKMTAVSIGPENGRETLSLQTRALYVDGRVKEYTTGNAHDVTEHTFVVQKISRVNDSLPQESGPPKWRWQRGGWLLVNRVSGKVQQMVLADFDPDFSLVNWFRDYAAYCGYSDDGEKLLAIIVQLGQRKPVLKKIIGETKDFPHCPAPLWERNPVRATFLPQADQKLTFAVKSRASDAVLDVASENSDEEKAGE